MTEDMRRAYGSSQVFLSTAATQNSDADRRRMLVEMWRQQAKMYGLDPDAMLAGGLPNGAPGAPPPAATDTATVTFAQNGDVGSIENAGTPPTLLRNTGQGPSTTERAPPVAQTANTAAEDSRASDAGPSPFESRIVDGEAELLARTAEGWDLVRDLPGERFLVRRRIHPEN